MTAMERAEDNLGEIDVPIAQRGKAVRVVASAAANAEECRMLLDMLGLKARQGIREPDRPAAPVTRLEVPAR